MEGYVNRSTHDKLHTNKFLPCVCEGERAKEGGGDKNTLKKNPFHHDDMSLCAYDRS
jgi:hypothetical protein